MNDIRVSLDDWRTRFHCGVELVLAVRECIENSANSPEGYADALYGACEYLNGLNNELNALVDGLFKKEGDA